ncbi:acyl--CoA ligase [Lentibacter algarum]|uniref:class I adenylate-forming enzyme family protein n=1 Tax=Lentibacter algarum TaxID=576131 RepID=UPI001C0686A3|nr:class I adenylate-forming enzyme family protein [Lentibacter algarum]MBU2982375.1 acyl--CoA ligase [Lentibacter algarum]
MLSISDTGVQAPCPSPFNFARHVLAGAKGREAKTALEVMSHDHDESWTFGALEQAVRGIGTGLLEAGLREGDIVLLRLGNHVSFPLAHLAAIAVGLVPVPTSAQLTEGEVSKMINELSPAAVIVGEGITCPEGDFLRLTETQMQAMHVLAPCDFSMGDPDRLAYIVYTSGTSGKPRAVMHAHRAVWARQMMIRDWYELSDSDRLCHAGAFNWTYTLGTGLMDPWSVGATALIPAEGVMPEQIAGLMKAHKATIFAAAPGVYRKMLKSGNALDLPDLRHGLSAGEKLSETIRQDWRAATGCEIYEAFGMSECSTFLSSSPSRPATNASLGHAQNGRCVAIVGDDGPLPRGETGQIAIHHQDAGLMLGYFGAEAETRQRFQGDWFLTGDLGVMHEDGQIAYKGRADDMMNAGGYRVSPVEVEQALQGFAGLTALAVTDVEVKADVRVIGCFYTSESDVDEAALKAFAQATLAAYKQPKLYRRLDSLPTGPNNKIRRAALKTLTLK